MFITFFNNIMFCLFYLLPCFFFSLLLFFYSFILIYIKYIFPILISCSFCIPKIMCLFSIKYVLIGMSFTNSILTQLSIGERLYMSSCLMYSRFFKIIKSEITLYRLLQMYYRKSNCTN